MAEDTGSVDVAIGEGTGEERGKVVLHWHEPRTMIFFDPQNAFEMAEHLARQAHKVRFGTWPDESKDRGYLAGQVRSRLTEEIRTRMIVRVTVMLNSLRTSPKSNSELAHEIVTTVMAGVA